MLVAQGVPTKDTATVEIDPQDIFLPNGPDDIEHFYVNANGSSARVTQRALNIQVTKARFEEVYRECPRSRDKLRLQAQLVKGAGGWKNAIPSNYNHVTKQLKLTDKEMKCAARLSYGLPVTKSVIPKCHCGANLMDDPCHASSCIADRRLAITGSHDSIVGAVTSMLQTHGFYARKEPNDAPSDEPRKRPDIVYYDSQGDLKYADFTATQENMKSQCRSIQPNPEQVKSHLNNRANYKKAKYAVFVGMHDAQLVPLVMGTLGGQHFAFRNLMTEIADAAISKQLCFDVDKGWYKGKLSQFFSVAMMKGNYWVAEAFVRKSSVALPVYEAPDGLWGMMGPGEVVGAFA
jgi:hypothetical protein